MIATALAFTLGGKFDEARLRAGAVGMHVSEEIQEKWINARNEYLSGGSSGTKGKFDPLILDRVNQWIDKRIGKSFFAAKELKSALINWYKVNGLLKEKDPDLEIVDKAVFSALIRMSPDELQAQVKNIKEVSFDPTDARPKDPFQMLHMRILSVASCKENSDAIPLILTYFPILFLPN